jgi:hypothetical protein
VCLPRSSAGRAQQLGRALIYFGEEPFALDVPNSREVGVSDPGLQVLQKGHQARGGSLLYVAFSSERTSYIPADATPLVDFWPRVHGETTRLRRAPFLSAANNVTEFC